MNQYAKEIHDDLQAMCTKYGITKGILLFEEHDAADKSKKRNRTIVFDPDLRNFDIEPFADLIERCINSSETLQTIIAFLNARSIHDLTKDSFFEEEVKLPKNQKIIN
jgi:hypothetical protein